MWQGQASHQSDQTTNQIAMTFRQQLKLSAVECWPNENSHDCYVDIFTSKREGNPGSWGLFSSLHLSLGEPKRVC